MESPGSEGEKEREGEGERERDRETQGDEDREGRDREREAEKDRDRDRERDREKVRETSAVEREVRKAAPSCRLWPPFGRLAAKFPFISLPYLGYSAPGQHDS